MQRGKFRLYWRHFVQQLYFTHIPHMPTRTATADGSKRHHKLPYADQQALYITQATEQEVATDCQRLQWWPYIIIKSEECLRIWTDVIGCTNGVRQWIVDIFGAEITHTSAAHRAWRYIRQQETSAVVRNRYLDVIPTHRPLNTLHSCAFISVERRNKYRQWLSSTQDH